MAKNISLLMELLKRKPTSRKVVLPYKQARDSRLKISVDDREKIQKLLDVVNEALSKTAFDVNISSSNLIRVSAFTIGGIKFDIDAGTRKIKKVVEDSGIKSSREKLIKTFVEPQE